MTNLSNIISEYLVKLNKVNVLESLYLFDFNKNDLPHNIKIESDKCFEKSIELKNKLNLKWIESEQPIKGDLIEYYIKKWGGIKKNSTIKMYEYRTHSTYQLLSRGFEGISSWSKALVIHDPENFYIYDSRVAFSINCIQHKFQLSDKYRFNIPTGQGQLVKKASEVLMCKYDFEKWNNQISQEETYSLYLKLLDFISIQTGFNKSKVEMSLFAIAPNLASELIYLS